MSVNTSLPSGWKWARLEDVCDISGEYGSNCRSIPYEKVRYVRITDIDDFGNLIEEKRVSPARIEEKYFLQQNDLLFARSGSVGRTYLHTQEEGIFQFAGYLIRYRPNIEIVFPLYLFYVTQSEFWNDWIRAQSKKATLININAKQFSSFSFPLPPLEEQKNMVAKLDKEMVVVKEMRQAAKKQLSEVDLLPSALLQKIFKL